VNDDQIEVTSSKAKTKITNNNDINNDITMNNNVDDDFSEQDISNILSKAKVTDASLDDLELLNLDDDLAKLEANLGKLGNFDFEMDDDSLQDIFGDISPTEMESESEGDLDSALRDIESGKFDINTFMKDDDVISDKIPDVDASIINGIDKSKARKKKSKGKDGDDDGIIEPPPLEEFKRLMESLGPDSMFDEESAYKSKALEEINTNVENEVYDLSPEETLWHPNIYTGGEPTHKITEKLKATDADLEERYNYINYHHEKPTEFRLLIVAAVTNSSVNTTAIEMVDQVFAYIKNGTENDERIEYQTIIMRDEDDKDGIFKPLENNLQMWIESYNCYHLIDGYAMKEAFGGLMPNIILSPKNLEAIVDQVKWALLEDSSGGVMLSPRLRRIRFRGGAQEMIFGYNLEELDSEYSVVSVR
jgi:hypothetical protein